MTALTGLPKGKGARPLSYLPRRGPNMMALASAALPPKIRSGIFLFRNKHVLAKIQTKKIRKKSLLDWSLFDLDTNYYTYQMYCSRTGYINGS